MYISGPFSSEYELNMILHPKGLTAENNVYAWMYIESLSFKAFNGIGEPNSLLHLEAICLALSTSCLASDINPQTA